MSYSFLGTEFWGVNPQVVQVYDLTTQKPMLWSQKSRMFHLFLLELAKQNKKQTCPHRLIMYVYIYIYEYMNI